MYHNTIINVKKTPRKALKCTYQGHLLAHQEKGVEVEGEALVQYLGVDVPHHLYHVSANFQQVYQHKTPNPSLARLTLPLHACPLLSCCQATAIGQKTIHFPTHLMFLSNPLLVLHMPTKTYEQNERTLQSIELDHMSVSMLGWCNTYDYFIVVAFFPSGPQFPCGSRICKLIFLGSCKPLIPMLNKVLLLVLDRN